MTHAAGDPAGPLLIAEGLVKRYNGSEAARDVKSFYRAR